MAQGCQLPVAVITGGRFGAPAEGPEILFALVQMVGGLVRAPFFDLVPQLTGDVRLQGQVSAQIPQIVQSVGVADRIHHDLAVPHVLSRPAGARGLSVRAGTSAVGQSLTQFRLRKLPVGGQP